MNLIELITTFFLSRIKLIKCAKSAIRFYFYKWGHEPGKFCGVFLVLQLVKSWYPYSDSACVKGTIASR